MSTWHTLNAAPYPAEISNWSEATKESQREAGKAVIAAIKKAATSGESEIKIPKGDYRFAETDGSNRPSFIHFRGMTNFTIDFQGSTLWFENEATGIVTSRSDHLTIKNAVLDWDPLPFTQGIITAVYPESSSFDVRIDPGYERVAPGMSASNGKLGGLRGMLFDANTRFIKAGQTGFTLSLDWNKPNDDGTYRLKYRGFYKIPITESNIEVGDAIAILKRMRRAIRIEAGSHSVMENITLYSSPFVAFASNVTSGEHGPVFRDCKIVRRPGTDRLIAGNADGFNISNSIEGPIVENCSIENIGDDFINVHGHLARVIWQDSPTEVISTRINYRGTITEPVEVEFLKRNTLESLGKRMVTSTLVKWTIEKERCLADLSRRMRSGDTTALAYGKTETLLKLQLDKPIQLEGDIIIACEKYSGANAIIRNNSMIGSLARGIRMQSPGALIENNRIAYTMGPALSLQGHAGYWGEGPYVHDVTVRNNTIVYGGLEGKNKDSAAIRIVDGDYAGRQIASNISITGNRIYQSPGAALIARGVKGLELSDNEIKAYGMAQATEDSLIGANHAIVLQNVSDLSTANNVIDDAGDFAEGALFQLDVSNKN
ncbi:right-handed parallel beta-helix repeat-containing protein [Coraliomargarita algicola]|uniref:Right-handed parallel beta-helix repeat-containing protein n=1 Tax=Coraliomargarita algicola TaxID=3092156 RepID=A0ABZ0RLU6_9BACT|nr:right-handed parallel beta-helix repeat-containing protein [Coraliomargarita sp. J2-16]WPJ96126.1 right-handed parallel beta-helix repeat-containing protein [Coraliomargarita sp. J2-16]